MRYILVSIILSFLICDPLLAQTPARASASPAPALPASLGKELTLTQAEGLALKNNPQITIGKLRALVARQYVREARSALLPTASLSVTAVDSNPGSRISAGFLNNPILFPRAAAGASVSQLVTDFGRSTNLLSSSEYQAKAENQNAAAATADITLAVDQAFYNVLETKALVVVAQQTVEARQLFVDKIKALTDAKLKSDLDLSFANVDLAKGKLLLLEAQNNYQTSLAGLSAILGFPDEQNFQLVEESAAIAPPTLDVLPLIQQALQQRPEVLALQDQVQAAQKFGSANINIPVFNGFLYNARAKAADLETEVNRQKLSNLRNNIARDVRNSWQDTNRAYERLSVTQQLREQASLSLNLAQARYNLGLGSIVEFSQAELQKTEADIADTDAKYQYRLTEIVLAYTISAPK
jgi:outer membrane protein